MLLVTGITGHSGRYFLNELAKNNYSGKIKCTIRKESNIKLLEESILDIDLCVGNLNDLSFINNIIHDVKTVLHIYNIHYSIEIVKAAIHNGVERVILVHTTGIYSNYKSASEEYKRIESEVIKIAENKIDLTILRPTMIYGDICDRNISKFIKLIDKNKIIPLINRGKSSIQPVNARDLGKAYYDVLVNPKETINKQFDLSGEKPISIKDTLKIISVNMNKKTIYIPVHLKFSILLAYLIKIFTLRKVDIVEKVQRMGEDRAYSHELAKQCFNYNPIAFEEGIKLEIDEYLKQFRK